MKPFKINRNSWHYKLNKNFFNGDSMYYDWEPKHNNFCSYWRATMFRMLFVGILSIMGIAALTGFGLAVYHDPIGSGIVFGSIIGFFAFIVGGVLFLEYLSNLEKNKVVKPDSLFMQKYKAHKSKICPMVEYD